VLSRPSVFVRMSIERLAKEQALNNFPILPQYGIKLFARSATSRGAAWTLMHRTSNDR
jgi:hypothetical protein